MPKPSGPLDTALISEQLRQTRFADIRYFADTRSTNADAQRLLGDARAYGTTFVAEYQSAGAGRKGRPWIAPPGCALLFTTILPEPIAAAALWAVPFWTALSVADAVHGECGIALDLLWPNDLYIRERKVGGILSVARVAGDEAWVGCGVGFNVVRPSADAELAALVPQPIFLNDVAPAVRREPLLAAILRTFDVSLGELREPDGVAKSWERRAGLLGTTYRYRHDADGIEREGTALRIGPHGSLIVREASGEVAVDMADVRVVSRDKSVFGRAR